MKLLQALSLWYLCLARAFFLLCVLPFTLGITTLYGFIEMFIMSRHVFFIFANKILFTNLTACTLWLDV